MAVRKIKADVYYVGAIDWHRRLFDSLIPTPDGTTYNAYLIKGKAKTALIDTVDPSKEAELLRNLDDAGVGSLDYIVSNHAEQDHSGLVGKMATLHPEAKIVTNAKCKEFLMDLLLVPGDRFMVVADGDTLELGGKTLKFMLAPWVHWPETMFTYLVEDKILFPCDFLGAHLAPAELLVESVDTFYEAAKRYYAEIMMPFRTSVTKHLERLSGIEIAMVAPSHGPIHTKPASIMKAYGEWASDRVKNEVVIPYVSMHGSTQRMVDHLTDRLIERQIAVKPFDMVATDLGKLAMALVDAATIVIAAPTVLVGPHPLAVYAAYLANALRPKTRFAGVIGSYGWGTKMVDTIKAQLPNLKVELLTPVVIKGYPKADDLKSLDTLADEILEKHRKAGIVTSLA
ncbi:MAG TPA: FprA family A-type flavoprotein [bacterium]|nr:FprA family A-type flavoprotein [bacterium]